MKRNIAIVLFVIAVLATSCSSQEKGGTADRPGTVQNQWDGRMGGEIQNADLDSLLESYDWSGPSDAVFELGSDSRGLPAGLLNELKEAIHRGESDAWLRDKNDGGLMVTADDFQFEPRAGEEGDAEEEKFNEAMEDGAYGYSFYRCELDGDRTDEIVVVSDLEYGYSGWNTAYLLKQSGDHYVYAGHDYFGYYRCFAVFPYGGEIFLAANYDDHQTRTAKAVGVFRLSGCGTGFMWLIGNDHAYVRKEGHGCLYDLLYENQNEPVAESVRSYVEEIGTDLVYVDRIHNTFYGDEARSYDLLEEGWETVQRNRLWNVFSIDIDQDGRDEYFDRGPLPGGPEKEMEVRWFDREGRTFYPAPYTVWHPAPYALSQTWFKVMDGRTVIFSLYRRRGEDGYLLDARMQEDGRTVVLLDYAVRVVSGIVLDDYWDYDDSNWMQSDYADPDREKAFPPGLGGSVAQFAANAQGGCREVGYDGGAIPNDLVLLLERALFEKNLDGLDLGSSSFEIGADEFRERYGEWDEGRGGHIYRYELGGRFYCLTVRDSGGSAGFVDAVFSRETDGGLEPVGSLILLDLDARMVSFGREPFLIAESYNYYSKYVDTILIYRLSAEGVDGGVAVSLTPDRFEWETVYNGGMPYQEELEEYIRSIREGLMEKSAIDDSIEVFTGDETYFFDHGRRLRLKSVAGDYDYYEVDFDNDGEKEYLSKRYWFPSNRTTLYLITELYRFTKDRIVEQSHELYEGGGALVQLWFKEIDGKVLTFRLFLHSGYNYVLNVSLIEGAKVTQVRTDMAVPVCQFQVTPIENP